MPVAWSEPSFDEVAICTNPFTPNVALAAPEEATEFAYPTVATLEVAAPIWLLVNPVIVGMVELKFQLPVMVEVLAKIANCW